MRLILCGMLSIFLFSQCSKSLQDKGPDPDNLASSVLPNFYVQLIDKNTGGNYITENNITTRDIEFRDALDQPVNFNVSITSVNDSLANILVFPVIDRNKIVLRIRKTIEIPLSYTSTITGSAGMKLNKFSVQGYAFTTAIINNNYLLRIKI
ncbi:hypothetical protein [Niabella soli]|uniref:Uncharacterized protein n=1 Tax=Niabella soli DSM 19437 TaxID=929713 RepID=W0F487_9BACT|nr:hypothetical protein [Niabella soli]AHF17812.1 hypothetical protein NIASO_14635 [Niabella soli DSM 19437]